MLDLAANEGFVSVGVTNDTSAFAVSSIRAWWMHLGQKRYPNATTLLITADGGGSNSSRTRLWRTELQKLALSASMWSGFGFLAMGPVDFGGTADAHDA